MDVPLEISFRNMDSSESVEAKIRERVEKLEKLYPRLVACRVAVETPHRQHQTHNIFRVRIDMSVPGNELVVSKEPNRVHEKYADPDVYTILRDAFDTAENQLRSFKAKQYGEVKAHDEPMHGQVINTTPEEDFGFLLTATGSQLKFHRNALFNEELENLKQGDHVHYVESVGDTGPQASKVWRVESAHQKRHVE